MSDSKQTTDGIKGAIHRFYMRYFYAGRQPGSYGRGAVGIANAFEDLQAQNERLRAEAALWRAEAIKLGHSGYLS